MTAIILKFPTPARVVSAVRLCCGEDGWLVIEPGGQAWPCRSRDDAVLTAFAAAHDLGVGVVELLP